MEAVLLVELTKTGEIVKICKRKEVKREIIGCLSRRFSLPYVNTTMETNYTSQI